LTGLSGFSFLRKAKHFVLHSMGFRSAITTVHLILAKNVLKIKRVWLLNTGSGHTTRFLGSVGAVGLSVQSVSGFLNLGQACAG
jgi:hypothetical protein